MSAHRDTARVAGAAVLAPTLLSGEAQRAATANSLGRGRRRSEDYAKETAVESLSTAPSHRADSPQMGSKKFHLPHRSWQTITAIGPKSDSNQSKTRRSSTFRSCTQTEVLCSSRTDRKRWSWPAETGEGTPQTSTSEDAAITRARLQWQMNMATDRVPLSHSSSPSIFHGLRPKNHLGST